MGFFVIPDLVRDPKFVTLSEMKGIMRYNLLQAQVVEWYTRSVQNAVPQGLEVQVLSWAQVQKSSVYWRFFELILGVRILIRAPGTREAGSLIRAGEN